MSDAKILIVEDEGIEALDMQYRLTSLGYPEPEIAFSGEEAVEKAKEMRPDLVLMDIMLRGEMDGVTAAGLIQSNFDVPIIYITAYADENTLNRAKITEPYGYIVKPFKERELHITIDVALYKHRMEKKLRENEKWLATTLKSIGDAVITTDRHGLITFMNPVAEGLMGWKQEELLGARLTEVFGIINRDTRLPVENPITRVLQEGITVGLANHTILIARDGAEVPIDDSAAPIKDDKGNMMGVVLVFRDITEREKSEAELAKFRAKADERAALLQGFLSSMADGAMLTDTKADVVFANEALRQLLHLPEDENYQDWLNRFKLYTIEGHALSNEKSGTLRALNGEVVIDRRLRIVNPYGKESLASVSSAPIRDAEGNIIAATNVFRDITKRVELERKTQELYERERHIAEVLQGALVPNEIASEMYSCRFAVNYKPALREAEVGGDFYDVFDLGDGRVCVMIGDVAGKGLQAAMRVASARYAIRGCAFIETKPSRILSLANESLCCGTETELDMLTAFLAIIDTRVGTVVFSNAGHEPPILMHPDGRIKELLRSGIPLGIMNGIEYTEGTCRLDPGSRILMVTDGITEARTSGVDLFGKERVIDYVCSNNSCPLQDVVDGLLQTASLHAGGELQDDAAIVAIELYNGKGM